MLQLKPIPDSDVDAFYEMISDPSLSVNTGSIPMGVDRAWALNRLRERREEEAAGKRVDDGLYDDETLVGMAGWFYNEHDQMEIGYAIHKDHRGKGLATRAAAMVVDKLREGGYNGAIFAQYFKDNPASGRVLEKLGFEKESSTEGPSASRVGLSPAWIAKLNALSDAGLQDAAAAKPLEGQSNK